MSGFGHSDFSQESDLIARGHFKQFRHFTVDLSAVTRGEDAIELPGNALLLLPRLMTPDGTIINSDTTANARVWIRFNSKDNPWIPFSLIAAGGDMNSAIGTITKFWVRVPTATAGAVLVFLLSLSFALGSATGGVSGGGYVGPSGSSSGGSSGGDSTTDPASNQGPGGVVITGYRKYMDIP